MLSVAAPLDGRAGRSDVPEADHRGGQRSALDRRLRRPVGVLDELQTAFDGRRPPRQAGPGRLRLALRSRRGDARASCCEARWLRSAPRSCATGSCPRVTGEPIDTAELDADYWYRNLRCRCASPTPHGTRSPTGAALFVECSPHPVLTGASRRRSRRPSGPPRSSGRCAATTAVRTRLRQALAEAYVRRRSGGLGPDALDVPVAQLAGAADLRLPARRHWLAETAHGPRPAQRVAAAWPPTPPTPPGVDEPPPPIAEPCEAWCIATTADVLGHGDASRRPIRLAASRTSASTPPAAVELRNRLARRDRAARCRPTLLFDYPTPGPARRPHVRRLVARR